MMFTGRRFVAQKNTVIGKLMLLVALRCIQKVNSDLQKKEMLLEAENA